jgi:serine/threonine protein kinase
MQLDTILADRYQIHEQLSSKAGRQTFLAQDLQSQDLVIIKVLRFGVSFQWDDLKLFEREASTLKNLAHPAIPQYLDYFELDLVDLRGFALVQTYLLAPSLETVVGEGRSFSEQDVTDIADRLLSILTYLHEQNPPVIHRDIKPSNILLSNRSAHSVGDVYLVDFGSVQTSANKDGGTVTIVGSYGYMPLEQFGGQTRAASDLYSLGMTLIYLLTGRHPAELIGTNGEIRFDRSNLSDQFARWLDKLIQPHLDKRFDSAKLAQTTLKSSNSWQERLTYAPPNSKIEVNYHHNILEINFHKNILSNKQENDASGCVMFLSIMFIAFVYLFYWVVATAILFFWCLAIVYLASRKSNNIFRSIIINKKTKTLQKSIHTPEYQRLVNQRLLGLNEGSDIKSKVDLLVYYPGRESVDFLKVEEGEKASRILPELSIHMGKRECAISDEAFSAEELYWIGKELSVFLDLPLQTIT